MLFEDKKLQLESIENLIQCPVHSIEPFALMLAPIYILMKLNQKLVSVKAPLDFFTEDELRKLKNHEVFYLPKFIKSSVRFQTAARLVKKILTVQQSELSATPFEISKETFRCLSELWGKQIQIEPFFMAIFADELCEALDQEKMLWARENTVINHDHGLLLSGALVFVALHLGWFDLNILNEIRKSIYERTVHGENWEKPTNEIEAIVGDLDKILRTEKYLNLTILRSTSKEWSAKLASRLCHLKNKNTNFSYESATIFGEEGFAA